MNKVVTRFSPSPTGKLHIGGIRTCLYSYLYAKKNNGKFIIRIEDTDSKRFDPEAEVYIKNTLNWLGIIPDEDPWIGGPNGPYRQTERDYSFEIKSLLDSGYAYYAFDTSDELDLARRDNPNFSYNHETRMKMKNSLSLDPSVVSKLIMDKTPYVIRFKVTENIEVSFDDEIRGTIKFNTSVIDDKVLVKSDGVPSYHLANTSDDYNMGVTHVIRGEEWIPSTPIHVLIYNALGRKVPTFAHLPLILNPDGKSKLSKRSALKNGVPVVPFGGDGLDDKGNLVSYKGFHDEGFSNNALLNFLALLGWNPGGDVEIMSIDDMIKSFSLDRVNKSGARFDIDKAKWINSQHLKRTNNCCLKPFIKVIDNRYSDDKLNMIIDLAKDRSSFKGELNNTVDIFYNDPIITDFKKIDDNFIKVFSVFILDDINFDSPDTIKDGINSICNDLGIKIGKVMPGLRTALVGGISGPDLATTMFILGKDTAISRISSAIQSVSMVL
jgi:glutamyl-tRNA synthetase